MMLSADINKLGDNMMRKETKRLNKRRNSYITYNQYEKG